MGIVGESWLCTPDAVKLEMNSSEGGGNTISEEYLQWMIPLVSREIENECGREFEPTPDTRTFYPNPVTVTPDYRVLTLREGKRDHYVGELRAVTNGTHALVLGTDVALHPDGITPRRKLRALKRGLWTRTQAACDGRDDYAVQVEADFVYRDRYSTDGWMLSGSKLQAELPASSDAATITGRVTDAHYSGFSGKFRPRFSVGMLLRVGIDESREFMRVVAVQPAEAEEEPDVLILRRGEKDTDAALHAVDTDIYIWSVQPEIVRACMRWVDLWYGRRSAFETTTITDVGLIRHPEMPADVKALLWRFLK